MYDVMTGQTIAEKKHAHYAKILHMQLVYDGYVFMQSRTCTFMYMYVTDIIY